MTHSAEKEALADALCHEYHPMHWDVAYGNRNKACEACKTHAARLITSGVVADLAETWNDGYDAGHQDARAVQPSYPDPTPNPYRDLPPAVPTRPTDGDEAREVGGR